MTIRPYVTSFQRSAGISALLMKKIVSGPFSRPGMPCARRPRLLSYKFLQRAQYMKLPMRWQYYTNSLVSSLRTTARTFFEYCRRSKVRALAVCRPISKPANITSWLLWRFPVLLLVLLAGMDSTSGGAAFSDSLISWRCIFRADMRGERRGGAVLGKSIAVVWAIGKFWESLGGYRLSGVLTLGGGLKATLGGGAVWRRGRGLMGNTKINFSGEGFSADAERRVILVLVVCCAGSLADFLFAALWAKIFCKLDRAVRALSPRWRFFFFFEDVSDVLCCGYDRCCCSDCRV